MEISKIYKEKLRLTNYCAIKHLLLQVIQYDRYQRGMTSMVYKFFDKKAGKTWTVVSRNQELANELHKLIQASILHKKVVPQKKIKRNKLTSLPQVKSFFTFAMWFLAFCVSFRLVQRAFRIGSITFLEINLVRN